VTFHVNFSFLLKKRLGFERKARLFCDVDFPYLLCYGMWQRLGFERKARLFCDIMISQVPIWIFGVTSWDLSVRLGYFVTALFTFFFISFFSP